MDKIGCKKCGSHNYRFEKKVKGNCLKFYCLCNDCGKRVRIFPRRIAYAMYDQLCKYEAAQQCQNSATGQEYMKKIFNIEKQLKKTYAYLYNNLTLFIAYILTTDQLGIIKMAAPKNLVDIVKKYKTPLRDSDHQNIIFELSDTLLKTKDDV